MERILAVLCLLFISTTAIGQVDLSADVHDFGLLRRADQNWHDFAITNKGDKEAVIFRLEAPKSVNVKFSSKTVKPDSTVLIRVQYNPPQAGSFKVDMDLHLSTWQKPQRLQLTGESTFASSGNMPCPDFTNTGGSQDRALNISIRDIETNQPIDQAIVDVYKDGRKVHSLYTDANGEISDQLPWGRYFISVKSGVNSADTAVYVSAVNDHLLVMLEADLRAAPQADYPPKVIPGTPEQTKVRPESVPAPERELEVQVISTSETDDSEVFPSRLYKQNNVVFLVDVSTSMKHMGRMDLLKIAMIDLLDVMRPTDMFTLISYSTETRLIVETTENLNKESCARAIAALEAGGNTAGAKAIDAAGKKALSFYLENGNNQIILATDGSFNEGHEQALKLASKFYRKGVHTSVLGIKCGKYTTTAMTELAAEGGGRFIPIESTNDAGSRLINEIKTSSRK